MISSKLQTWFEIPASIAGFLRGSATRSDTSVSGSVRTVAGNPAMGIGSRVEGGISSRTTVTDSFRLVNPRTREEQNFALMNYHLQIWDDQKVSVAQAVRRNGNWNVLIVVVIRGSGEQVGAVENLLIIQRRRIADADRGFNYMFFVQIFSPIAEAGQPMTVPLLSDQETSPEAGLQNF